MITFLSLRKSSFRSSPSQGLARLSSRPLLLDYQPQRSTTIMTTTTTQHRDMKAAVVYEPGGAEVFKVEKRQIPQPVRLSES